jgi:aspartyl-tRNA synthetase
VREAGCTVQCVLSVAENIVSKGMVKYVNKISKESIVDVEGIVSVPEKPIEGTSQKVWHLTVALNKQSFRNKHKGYGLKQNCYSLFYIECDLDLQVEIQARKVYCISKAAAQLPLNLEDAARSERDFEKAEKDPQQGVQFVRVGQDTRLNNRVLDLRTPANQAIFRIQSQVSTVSILPWFFNQLCQCTSFWCHDCCCNISVYPISNTRSLVNAKMWIGMDNSSSDSSCWQRTLWSFTHQSC